MRRCKINIELDREDPTYTLSEPVTGQVIVDVRRHTRCDEFSLKCTLKTHGSGDRYRRVKETINLFSGEWEVGQYVYPFRIPLDSTQTSYHGEVVNVDWYLEAEVDIPSALNVRKKVDFLRVPGETFNPEPVDYIKQTRRNKRRFFSWIGGIFFLLFVPFLFIAPLMRSDDPPRFLQPLTDILASHEIVLTKMFGWLPDSLFPVFLVIVLAIIIPVILSKLLQKMAEKILGEIVIKFDGDDTCTPGETLYGSIRFTPHKSARIKQCLVTLRCREYARNTSGTTDSIANHTLYEDLFEIPFYQPLMVGVEVDKNMEVHIPAGAPASFSLGNNKLIWEIQVDIRLARFLKWRSVKTLKVSALTNDQYAPAT